MTDAQQRAIHTHDRNLIVVAGAGSGKTYTLVNRYLALMDAHPEWPLNALVAITFTRKAAQEMRDRVRRELEARYQAATDTHLRESWAARLASIESARIDTIHGLCTDLLRANAAEAGIDPQFDVLDEIQAAQLLDDTLDSLLVELVANDDPSVELFREVDERAVRAALKDSIGVELRPLDGDGYAAWERAATLKLDALVHGETFQAAYSYRDDTPPDEGDDKLQAVCKAITPSLDFLVSPSTPLSQREGEHLEACCATLKALPEQIKLTGGAAKYWSSGEKVKAVRAVLKELRESVEEWVKAIGDPVLERRAAALLPLWHRLIERAQEAYRAAKDEAGVLDFNDLEGLTRDLLQSYPAVRDRYQNVAFKHLLVDEFQDTNADQWAIIRSLIDLEVPGSLFVVGDPKQSIYQFRGADVSVFEQVREQILAAGGESLDLARSFRTHGSLVNAFNHLFGAVLVKDPTSLTPDYEIELGTPMDAVRPEPPSLAPPIELLLLDKSGLDDSDERSADVRRWEADVLARRIQTLVSEEARPVYDRAAGTNRPMRYGDVALLFQSTSNLTLYEDAFKAHGLPYLTVAGRGYFDRQEVHDVLNLLTALHNPTDELALASALRSPLFNLSDEDLLRLRLMRDEAGERLPLWEALQDSTQRQRENTEEEENTYSKGAMRQSRKEEDVATPFMASVSSVVGRAADILAGLRGMAGRVTIAELLRTALDQTGFLATLTALPDGARLRGNVEKLLDRARTSGQVTLGAFEAYLRDLSASEAREGEAAVEAGDTITLMTVHASKGLEFPLVVLVDSGWQRGNRGGGAVLHADREGLACKVYDAEAEKLVATSAYVHIQRLNDSRQQAERKRLLYVAATRAQDYLLISGTINYNEKESMWKRAGWLDLVWEPLGLDHIELRAGEPLQVQHSWGTLQAMFLNTPTDSIDESQASSTLWDDPRIERGERLPGAVSIPALLQPVRISRANIARHLTATQIADAGAATYDHRHGERFRREVLRAAPLRIDRVTEQGERVAGRIIGEMVHRVLKFDHIPDVEAALNPILQSYAWELGVVEPGKQQYAMQEARKLLRQSRASGIHQQLTQAERIYREIPFVYRAEQRIIHGVLDVLFQSPDGTWNVLDYKTSYVEDYGTHPDALDQHARRYHLQVGVYAAAVQEQLDGSVPDVYIHYIRYGQTVRIPGDQWRAALTTLEDSIGGLLNESDWIA
jgi:ATP-dependent helicase/nuclease subunit A